MTDTNTTGAWQRTVRIIVRVTVTEKEKLVTLAKQAGLTLSDYVRGKAIGSKPVVKKTKPGEETLLKLLYHISKTGVNLNQVARQLNRKQDNDEFEMPLIEIRALVNELKEISAAIRHALHERN